MSLLSEATAANLRRKSAYVDEVQTYSDGIGAPMPSWIDLSLTELCNRRCSFCPRADASFYPNQPLHMDLALISSIGGDLAASGYRGSVVLCGFGEPLLHPRLGAVIETLAGRGWRLELVTNGDRLETLGSLIHKLDCTVVSMYDGPYQVEHFHDFFARRLIPPDKYVLRDRWHTEADAFGLKLTNRAGTVEAGHQGPALPGRPCNYLAYQMTVDWNGDVLLCPQDWHKKVKFGNLNRERVRDVWISRAMHQRRMQLLRGDRTHSPCHGCNTDGCLHGFNHVPIWEARAQPSASSAMAALPKEPAGESA